MAQTGAARSTERGAVQERRRHYRVERRFSSDRRPRALVRDLLRAHSGR